VGGRVGGAELLLCIMAALGGLIHSISLQLAAIVIRQLVLGMNTGDNTLTHLLAAFRVWGRWGVLGLVLVLVVQQ